MNVRFLRSVIAVVVGAFFMAITPFSLAGSREELSKLAKYYEISIVYEPDDIPNEYRNARISGQYATAAQLNFYTPMLITEFGCYPKEFIAKSELQQIVLCTGLRFGEQQRNAIPDFEHNTLYLDVARGAHAPEYLKTVIHHECFTLSTCGTMRSSIKTRNGRASIDLIFGMGAVAAMFKTIHPSRNSSIREPDS